MKKSFFFSVFWLCLSATSLAQQRGNGIVTNPIDLNYQFQPKDNDPARREAADPVAEYFKGYYYLFASKSSGYWRSPDLVKWEYIPCTSIPIINDYAPTILPLGDTLYFTSSSDANETRIFKTTTPEKGDSWEEIDCKLDCHQHDPAFFLDDDGRVYFYWGCHDVEPIYGFEVDPNDGFRAKGEPVKLIDHHVDLYGWEQPGVNNEEPRNGWNEGPAMLKYKGKYYLQYAGPGTQYRIYADGIYVGDSPLGPFTYVEDNPFCIKPGGFIGAAGHGHTFKDRYGNYWHVASMLVGVRHWFERRLGLFPVTVDDTKGMRAYTVFTDYPFYIPDTKVGCQNERTLSMGWRLLSLRKQATASSALPEHDPALATDEQVETWWAAQTGDSGEWLQVDLGSQQTVRAIQVNLADEGFQVYPPYDPVVYQYVIEGSADGKKWNVLADYSEAKEDAPHALAVLPEASIVRYVRITNTKKMDGCFSLMDLRVFGDDTRPALAPVTGFVATREAGDKRAYSFQWNPVDQADGYILYWGTKKDDLSHAVMVLGTSYKARYFNRDSEYFFRVEAF